MKADILVTLVGPQKEPDASILGEIPELIIKVLPDLSGKRIKVAYERDPHLAKSKLVVEADEGNRVAYALSVLNLSTEIQEMTAV